MRCEVNLPIFQAPIVIKQRTAKTDVGGGTLTAGALGWGNTDKK
jgi:hypothetical protein